MSEKIKPLINKKNFNRIEAAEYLRVSPSWLDKDFAKGEFSTFPCIKLGGRRIYQRDQLDQILKSLSSGGTKLIKKGFVAGNSKFNEITR